MLRSAESDHPKIISREVISDELKRHRPTDRRATCRSNTALSAASRSKNEARRWKNFDYTFSRFGTIPACTVIHKLSPNKQCSSDQIPTRPLRDNADLLASFIAELCNRHCRLACFRCSSSLHSSLHPLKKPDMDSAD